MFPLEKSLYSLYFHELAKIERVALRGLALLLKTGRQIAGQQLPNKSSPRGD